MGPMHAGQSALPRSRATAATALLVVALLGGCQALPTAEPFTGSPTAVTVPSDVAVGESDGGPGRTPSPDAPQPLASADSGAPAPSPTTSTAPSPASAAAAGEADGEATCPDLQAAWSETNKALVTLDPEHPRALVASLRSADRAVSSVTPPAAVAESWEAMAGYLRRVTGALQDVDPDDGAAVSSAMTHTVTADDTARVTRAHEQVTDFIAGGCAAR